MAHQFLGTFNKSQWERFIAYARSQLVLVDERYAHLKAEIGRIGTLAYRYDNGIPQGYSATPTSSYLAKLLSTYEVLGGNPFIDLRIRLREDPIFMIKGTETSGPQYMSNGEVIGAEGLSDAPTSELSRDAMKWIEDTLNFRFNALERKIRRAVDYSDELKLELARLEVIKKTADTSGSLEYIASQVSQYLSDQNYRAVFDDQGSDVFGLTIYAPFSSYDSNGAASETAQRQNTGFVGPGSGR
jgi:hypothetical protein